MAFSPITDPSHLPTVGTKGEDLSCDFKGTIKGALPGELAKDVAAFANAAGGTIVIGAQENKTTNTLQAWVPMTLADASADKKSIDAAILAHCSPLPTFDPQVIQRTPTDWVVAVNVWPYDLLPVGVRLPVDPAFGKQWDAWAFFVRSGTQTNILTAEEASMLMLPAVRRTIILLGTIPVGKKQGVSVHFQMPQMTPVSAQSKVSYLDLVDVKPLQNVAIFIAHQVNQPGSHPVAHGTHLHIPLPAIDLVWPLASGSWAMRIKGQIHSVNNVPLYVPNP